MHVVATAGHVDHGKSTLVHTLTGMEPDRWAEERRRGMTIDLGFAWTDLPSGQRIAFVDVPGHERFLTNMLAGVGAAPAVLFVVAADEGWKPQSQEHLDALAAFGVRDVILVVTKADLADPSMALRDGRERLTAAGVRDISAVAVSATTDVGLDELVEALDKLVVGLPQPDPLAPVRLWIDRAFTIRGAGTVVTGTLTAGTISVGDKLLVAPSMRPVVVRRLESCKENRNEVAGTARVALNLRGLEQSAVSRGMALVTPDAWTLTTEAELAVASDLRVREVVAHLGSAAVPARIRRLSNGSVRARFAQPLPLGTGDVLLLRAPGSREMTRGEVTDPRPAQPRRVTEPRSAGVSPSVAAEPAAPSAALRAVLEQLDGSPPAALEVAALQAAGVPASELSWATRTGRLVRISPALVMAADGAERATALLRALPQPFTVSDAGRALGTTRRVTVPLLEHLDSRRLTRRLDDGKRAVSTSPA